MVAIQAPGPLDRTCAEHQGAAAVAIEGKAVSWCAGTVVGTPVQQIQKLNVHRRRRQRERAVGPEAVVAILVPLVAQRSRRHRVRCAWRQRRDGGIAPEAQVAVGGGHLDGVVTRTVHGEERAGQGIFRVPAVRRGAEARVAPSASPGRRICRIDRLVGVGLLVANQCAIGGPRAIDAGLPARLPEQLVAAEESEMHAQPARRLDVGALSARPVLVVTHRKEHLVPQDEGTVPLAVNTSGVADVVAVGFEPTDHGVLGAEEESDGVVARGEGTVVTDLVGATGRCRPPIKAIATVVVIGLPGRIGGLEEHGRVARVVPDDEEDMTRP